MTVPIYRYDETTSQWVAAAIGVVGTDGNVTAQMEELYGLISALPSFTPVRIQLRETVIISEPGGGCRCPRGTCIRTCRR